MANTNIKLRVWQNLSINLKGIILKLQFKFFSLESVAV